MWSNLNDSFSAFTGHINTLRQSIPSIPFTGEEDNIKRCNKSKIYLLKAEVSRHRQIASEYKKRWLKAQEAAQLAGLSVEGYHDEISLIDDDDVVLEDDQSSEHTEEGFDNNPQLGDDGDSPQKIRREPLQIPTSISDLRLSASISRIHQLEDEIRKLDADREHWRSLAKQNNNSEDENVDTKKELEHFHDEYHKSLAARSELEQQLLELDSQHELALNKVIRMRDETVAENVQLRARIAELEQRQNTLEAAHCLSEPASSVTPLPETECKALTHGDLSNRQVLSSVEFDCLLHSNQRPEPDGHESDHDNDKASPGLVEDLRKEIQHLSGASKLLEEQLQKTSQSEKKAERRYEQLQQNLNELAREKDEQSQEFCARIEHLNGVISRLQQNISEREQTGKVEAESDDSQNEQAKQLRQQFEQLKLEHNNVDQQLQQVNAELEASREECQQLKEAMKRMSMLVQQKDQEVNALNEKTNQMEVQLDSRQSNVQLHESQVQRLELELSRLREHMVSVEENYVADLVVSNDKCEALERELNELRSQISSVEAKDDEIRCLRTARDKAINELSSLEDRLQQYSTSVSNLQGVIEQLERDHERKLHLKSLEADKRIEAEKQMTMGVTKQLKYVEERYRETVQTLEAANRLTQAIEQKDIQINQLKAELKIREDQILQLQERIIKLELSYEGKVDKQIIKSLVLSYFSTQPGTPQRAEGERLLARFLDFNQAEMDRASIRIGKSKDDPNESLVSRFVEFLEHESQKEPSGQPGGSGSGSSQQNIELAKDLTKRLSVSGQASRPVNPFMSASMLTHQRTPSNVSSTSTVSEHSGIHNQLLVGTLQPPETLVTPIEFSQPSDLNDV